MVVFTLIAGAIGLGSLATAAFVAIGLAATQYALQAYQQSRAEAKAERERRQELANRDWSLPVDAPLIPLFGVFGRANVAGGQVFKENRDGNVTALYFTGIGPVDGFDSIRINDRDVLLDDDGKVVTQPFTDLVTIETRRGFSDQTSCDLLQADYPEWTADHRLIDLSWLAFKQAAVDVDQYQETYDSQIITVDGAMRGLLLWDPRDTDQDAADKNTWAWSENPAIAALNAVLAPWGFRVPMAEVNVESFTRVADLMDVRGWTISGTFDLNVNPKTTFADVIETFRGDIYYDSAGRISLTCAPWGRCELATSNAGPGDGDLVITDADILEMEFAEDGIQALTAFNTVKPTYRPENRDYKQDQAVAVSDEDRVDEAGNEIAESPDFEMVPLHDQARWLGRMDLYESNPVAMFRGSFRPRLALQIENPDDLDDKRRCWIDSEAFGLSGPVMITEYGESDDMSVVTIAGKILTADAWDEPAYVAQPDEPPQTAQDDKVPPAPVFLSATVCDPQVHLFFKRDLRADITAPLTPHTFFEDVTRSGSRLQLDWRTRPTGDWRAEVVGVDDQQLVLFGTNGVGGTRPADGTDIEFRVREITSREVPGAYAFHTFTMSPLTMADPEGGDDIPVPPGAITSVALEAGEGYFDIGVVQSATGGVVAVEITTGPAGVAPDWDEASVLSAGRSMPLERRFTAPTGDRDVHVRALACGGALGPVTGPITTTVEAPTVTTPSGTQSPNNGSGNADGGYSSDTSGPGEFSPPGFDTSFGDGGSSSGNSGSEAPGGLY